MIRASIGNANYWNTRVSKDIAWFEESREIIKLSQNPIYIPQFCFDLSKDYLSGILNRYSRGDAIEELQQYFPKLLEAWELSNSLAKNISAEYELEKCRDWTFELSNLNHYNYCFWVVGLGILLEVTHDQWDRVISLVSSEGEDILLDRVISTNQPNRKIGNTLLHKKPYGRLLKALDAPLPEQPVLLKDFLDNWYPELARKGNNELWWYTYGDPVKHPLEMGGYFGRWCIEAAAVSKIFEIDDSLCIGHEHYPGDLLRPSGPSTHPARVTSGRSWLSNLFKKG